MSRSAIFGNDVSIAEGVLKARSRLVHFPSIALTHCDSTTNDESNVLPAGSRSLGGTYLCAVRKQDDRDQLALSLCYYTKLPSL